ncbi:hypothetical protein D3C77_28570 [compost metagenome]
MSVPPITTKCKFKQGKHCTKIGSKCVEDRWFNDSPCLIAEKIRYQYGRQIECDEPRSAPPKKP